MLLQRAEEQLSRFGLTSFRSGQDQVIGAVLEGKDCLCIMPTGGGKSLCYQLPAVMREGMTLVVSPLIALMKDQVDSLQQLRLSATFINSSLTVNEQRERIQGMRRGEYDLVYIAPERLRQSMFVSAVKECNLSLLAIDEAHCISEWGHDFRPDYARLGDFRERIGEPQTIALTATATPTVRADVLKQLRIESADVFVTGFARPNLQFEVELPSTDKEKSAALMRLLQETNGPAIVYAATRKRCEELSELIGAGLKVKTGVYHGGLEPEARHNIQESFMSGGMDVIVATNAFGMGVDKSDLRLVAHYNLPGSLEAYYQEAGRAGRDGETSRCVLLFSYADRIIQEYFIENNYPDRATVSQVYEFLRAQPSDPIELTQQEIREVARMKVGAEGVGAAIRILDRKGAAVRRLESSEKHASFWLNTDDSNLAECLPREATVQRKVIRTVERIVGDQRRELVPIRLEYLQHEAGLERDQLLRALRELTSLPQFDYVAPFRGRALHVVDRERRFADLEIDFEEIADRRKAEIGKLDRVVAYAYAKRCRQQFILDYFGDPERAVCGQCDQCQGRANSNVPDRVQCPHTPQLTQVIRKILSGVARTRGRFGKNVVAQMLGGSKSSKLSKFGLDRLTTFGLLSDFTQKEISLLIDELITHDLLAQNDVDRFRPIVKLSTRGAEVMRGERDLDGAYWVTAPMLGRLGAHQRAADPGPPPNAAIQSVLTQWRNETAKHNNQPVYTVLHNATIDRIASAKPATMSELQKIRGVGPQCLRAWGTEILELVASAKELASGAAAAFQSPLAESAADVRDEDESQQPLVLDEKRTPSIDAEVIDESAPRQHPEAKAPTPPRDEDVDPEVWSFTALDTLGESSQSSGDDPIDQLSDDEPVVDEEPLAAAMPDAYWTWRLVQAGFNEEECQQIRGISAEQVAEHLAAAQRANWANTSEFSP